MSAAAPSTLRAFVLDECAARKAGNGQPARDGRPQAVRETAKIIAGELDDGGALLHTLRRAPVAGKALTVDGDNRERDMRSDFLPVLSRILCKLVVHVDIVTGDIGRGPDRKFYGLRVDTLAEAMGLCQRRVERVIEVLSKAGMIRSWTRAEKREDGTFVGHTAIRKISMEAILRLCKPGALTAWVKAQRDEYDRRKRLPPSPEQQARDELRRVAREHASEARSASPRYARPGRFEDFVNPAAALSRLTKPPG